MLETAGHPDSENAALIGVHAGGERPATIRDVASHAGVSHQTVARFLKGDTSIKKPARERIKLAIEQLDYRTNRSAQSLKTGKTNTVGLFILEIDDPGPARTVKGAIHAARNAGYVLDTIALDTGDAEEIESVLESIRHQGLDAILSLDYTDQMAQALREADLPIPLMMSNAVAGLGDELASDAPAAGVPFVVQHLAELGHERLLHVAGPHTWPAARRRSRAFEQAVEDRGLVSAGIVNGDWTARSGFDAINSLGPELDFTAVVAANDRMALGVIRALTLRGLRVPDDMSVTGIDDMPDAEFTSPPLTTLRVDFEQAGHDSFLSLLATMKGEPSPVIPLVPAPLVVRESTGPRPAAQK
ncbi:LacI family DNA-binding transcriptional regulator [Timonella senegalensis]|uniref:LacI family DNA-binding transcriptional regulator n=1 Tax=Timonella senegalensis TaxID=1465825 RepID=UPI002FDCFDD9